MAANVTLPPGFELEDGAVAGASIPAGFELEDSGNGSGLFSNFGQQLGRQVGLTGRYAIEGFAALPAMVANVPAAAYNAGADVIAGKGRGFRFPEQSRAVSDVLTRIGMPQPQTGLERVIADASRALSSTGGSVAAGKAIPKLQALATKPGLQARGAVGSSVAAGATREAGGGPVAQLGAGVLGGGLATMTNKPKTPLPPTSQAMRTESSAKYQQADELGGILKPELSNKFIAKAQSVTPQTEAGKILAGENPVTKIVERIGNLKNRALTLTEAQEIDELLGDEIDSFSQMGVLNKQGKKLLDIQTSFREMINNASESDIVGGKQGFEALKQGRALWARAARLRDIEKIVARAEIANDSASALKSGFSSLWLNKERLKGFSEYEKELIRKAASPTVAGDVLKSLSSRLITQIAAGTGSMTGAAMGQAAQVAAKGMRAKSGANQALKISDAIARGGPPPKPDFTNERISRSLGLMQGLTQ
jgi:hypothetical protein